MKKTTILLICFTIMSPLMAFANPEFVQCSYSEISLRCDDPRLFSYKDTIGINKDFIDSLLREIEKLPCQSFSYATYDTLRQVSSEELEVIMIASLIADNNLSLQHTYGSFLVSKDKLKELIDSFATKPNIESIDIINLINKDKLYWIHSSIHPLYDCEFMNQLLMLSTRIKDKYRNNIIDENLHKILNYENCAFFEESDTTNIQERIKDLNWAQSLLMHYANGYKTSMFDQQLLRIQENIDSLTEILDNSFR